MDIAPIAMRRMLVGASMHARHRDLRSPLRASLFSDGASGARDGDGDGARRRRPIGQDLRSLRPTLRAFAVALALCGLSGAALAQSSSASYQIPRQTIDGGAQRSTSATYTLDVTIGQPDAGPVMTSGSYELRGGFHRPAATGPLPDPLFSDGFEPP
jgi:hypothetical protein